MRLLLTLSIALLYSTITFTHYTTPSVEDIVNQVQQEDVEFIDCLFTDLLGNLRQIIIPAHQLSDAFENGLKFDGSSIPGCSLIQESDMHLKLDATTFRTLSWINSHKSAYIICDVYRDAQTPYEADPRSLLKAMEHRFYENGYTMYVGPEIEFFILDKSDSSLVRPSDHRKYMDADLFGDMHGFKKAVLSALTAQGVAVEKWHHEVASGQNEISIHYGTPVSIADQIVIAKHTIKTFCDWYGLQATFMPKPMFGQNGSAMHVHFSIADDNGDNLFYDADDAAFLSPFAKQFIAGVLRHIKELCAFCNPTINSYKRLVPGYEAPVYLCWAKRNRSALIRIPQINENQGYAVRAELRSPDSLGNPYLIFLSIMTAGWDGLASQTEIPKPVETNLYKMSLTDIYAQGISTLPTSLEQAVELLKHSSFVHETFSPRLIEEFVKAKTKEITSYNQTVTNWEIEQYL